MLEESMQTTMNPENQIQQSSLINNQSIKKKRNVQFLKVLSHIKQWGQMIILNGTYHSQKLYQSFEIMLTLPVVEKIYICNNAEPLIINHIKHIQFDNLILLNLKGNNIESVESLYKIKCVHLNQLCLEDNKITRLHSLRKAGFFYQLRVLSLGFNYITEARNFDYLSEFNVPCLKNISINNRVIKPPTLIIGFQTRTIDHSIMTDHRWIAKMEPKYMNVVKITSSALKSEQKIQRFLKKRNNFMAFVVIL